MSSAEPDIDKVSDNGVERLCQRSMVDYASRVYLHVTTRQQYKPIVDERVTSKKGTEATYH